MVAIHRSRASLTPWMGCDLALVAQVEARLESVRHRGGMCRCST